jgi:UDP-2,4-diacetamido-2,4,6-trideoxy-beta-L-altropyranose hydrolase
VSFWRGAEVAFRADASTHIGSGHVMRCLAIADALAAAGARCRFVQRRQSGDLLALVARRGHEAIELPAPQAAAACVDSEPPHADWLGGPWPADAQQTTQALAGRRPDWLVVDHYGIDTRWEATLRPHVGRVLVVDDLADRPHDCDLLLDHNLGRRAEDYRGRVPDAAQVLAGPAQALLVAAYAQRRAVALARRASAQPAQLLVFMGAGNPGGLTEIVLRGLKAAPLPAGWRVTVVMGRDAPGLDAVRSAAAALPWPVALHVGVSVDRMADLVAQADLAIGSAGTSAWERCCLGLPTLLAVAADNQRAGALALQSARAAHLLDLADPAAKIEAATRELLRPGALAAMSTAAAALIDGLGVARLLAAMEAVGV